jgi:hypothetical protein
VQDPVALCAGAVAGWHDSWLKALGLRSETDNGVWRALDAPPFIYFGAITLQPETPVEAVLAAPGSVCDSWHRLDLAAHGYTVFRQEPWFFRPPGSLTDTTPPELELVAVSTNAEVEEFEAVSVRGFGGEDDSVEPGTFHPPTVLEDGAMKMFIGRVHGRPVAGSMGYRIEGAVGVFGVTTIPSARRRGYGAALTRVAMQTDTGLPSVLAPSKEGESVYLKMGFEPVGALTIWQPPT